MALPLPLAPCLPACLQKKEIEAEDTWLLGGKKGGKGKGKAKKGAWLLVGVEH